MLCYLQVKFYLRLAFRLLKLSTDRFHTDIHKDCQIMQGYFKHLHAQELRRTARFKVVTDS